MKKRITALLLAFAMLFTLSAAALAADESALVPEPAAAELAAETPTPLPEAAEAKTGAPAEQLAAPRPVLRAVEAAATHTAHHPYCGDKTCEDHGDAIDNWVDLKTVTVSSTAKLTGNTAYYLSGDLSVSSHGCAYKVDCAGQTVTLCLNGYTLSVTDDKTWGRAFNVINGTLRICDCSEAQSGKIITNGTAGDGAVIMLRDSAPTLELYGGTLTSTVSVANGGVICQNKGTFHMYGGTITGGKATKAADQNKYGGGGVYVGGGTFYMHGGTITGCTATENGGGVYLNGGTFIVSGTATITGNHVGKADNNVYLPAGKTITADDLTSGAQIGVTAASAPTAITGTNDADVHNYFTSDNSAYEPWNGDKNTVLLRTARTTPTCNAPSGLTAVYGQKLSEIELTNPEGNTPGTWTWENGNQDVGNVGDHTFKATFTPTDGDSYKTVTGIDVTVTVEQADQTITISGKDHTIIRNGVAQSIDFAHAEGAIAYELDGTYTGVTLDAENKKLTADSTAQLGETVKIKVTAEATENYKEANNFFEVTIVDRKSKSLTVTMENWTYGETKEPTVTGLPEGVALSQTTIRYTDKDDNPVTNPTNVGSYTVTVTYQTDTEEYSGWDDFSIVAKQITPPTADGRTFTYTGEDQTYMLATSTYYDISNNATQKNAGTYTITVSLKDTANTEWKTGGTADVTFTFNITKADGAVTAPAGKAGLVYTGQAQELLGTLATSATGTVQYKLDDGDWGTVPPTAMNAGTYNVYYRSVGDENHESTADTAYITVEIAKKQIDVPAADDTAFTYTGENLTYTPGNLDAEHCTVAGNVQKDAGTHDVIASLKDTANTEWKTGGTADKTYTFTIAQAKLTLRALDKKITAGQPAPDLSNPVLNEDYTVEGTLYGSDTLDITMAYDPADTSKAGTYTITIAAAAMANYDITTVPGTLTVEAVQTSQKLGISTPPRTPGGTLELTPKNAKPGDTVTITVKPDKGFELGGLTVRDVNGDKLDLIRECDNEFSFTMPKSSVKISANFVAEDDDVLFRDIPTGAYFYDAVKWARQNGITDGIGSGLFGAAFPCTRAQIVTFLWRAAGSPEPQNDVTFTDVPSTAYYAKAVAWAVEAGITNGVGGGKFDPDAPCTRAQAVAFLYRAAGEPTVRGTADFDDVAENSYYAAAVAWAQRQSITDGVTPTRFAPDDDCTRAQIVTFLYRAFAE